MRRFVARLVADPLVRLAPICLLAFLVAGSHDLAAAEGPGLAAAAYPQDFRTREHGAGQGLMAIKAAAAYARGATGEGIVVAVLDSGIDGSHPDLARRIVPGGYNFLDGNARLDDLDPVSHGTHIAGTIAAARNGTGVQGVAYKAGILPLKVHDSTRFADDAVLGEAYRYAIDRGARVINTSWGSRYEITDRPITEDWVAANRSDLLAALRRANRSDVISVWSTGNQAQPDPAVEAGLPALFPDLEDTWLAVTAIDPSGGSIATSANRCGVAAAWCVAAPGVNIVSTVAMADGDADGPATGARSGTSMAAAHASGAVALLIGRFPDLTPRQVVRILKAAARDLGPPGVDPIYGHGLIDLDRAASLAQLASANRIDLAAGFDRRGIRGVRTLREMVTVAEPSDFAASIREERRTDGTNARVALIRRQGREGPRSSNSIGRRRHRTTFLVNPVCWDGSHGLSRPRARQITSLSSRVHRLPSAHLKPRGRAPPRNAWGLTRDLWGEGQDKTA